MISIERFVFIALIVSFSQSITLPFRIACREGQPPMNDFVGGKCVGLFADIFNEITTQNNVSFAYPIEFVEGDIDKYLNASAPVNSTVPQYDLIIGFHTVTPERLLLYDFSTTITQSQDAVILHPRFARQSGKLLEAVLRRAVFFMLSLYTGYVGIAAWIILWLEGRQPNSPIHKVRYVVKRVFWALDMAFEGIPQGMTSEVLESQLARTILKLLAIIHIFINSIFCAVITSQLTSSALTREHYTTRDLRGLNLAISSTTLVPFLRGQKVNARTTFVENLNVFTEEWFAGKHPDIDGICGAFLIVDTMYKMYEGDVRGYLMTDQMSPSGIPDNRAFPIRRVNDTTGSSAALRNFFDVGLLSLRNDGTLATLIERYTMVYFKNTANVDISISPLWSLILYYGNIVMYAIALSVVVALSGLWFWNNQCQTRFAQRAAPNIQNPIQNHNKVRWRNKSFDVKLKAHSDFLDQLVELL